MMNSVPSLFVSHGLPPMALIDDPYNSAVINFGRNIEIHGVVCVSSHWVSPGPVQIASNTTPFIQHNFHGYQKEIYDLDYKTPYSENLINEVIGLLQESSIEVVKNPHYGMDHGIWMPMRLIRPEGDLPVVQLSLPLYESARNVMKIGHCLSSLRKKGILLMGSGIAAFNASKIKWHSRGEDVNPKILEFDNWLENRLISARIEDILDYRKSSPYGEFAHPSSATLLPLFFTIGTSMHGDLPQILYKGFKYSSTSLLTFCLGQEKILNKSLS